LTGTIDSILSSFSDLYTLILTNNQIHSTIPTLPSSLKRLEIGNNKLNGSLPQLNDEFEKL